MLTLLCFEKIFFRNLKKKNNIQIIKSEKKIFNLGVHFVEEKKKKYSASIARIKLL